MNALKGLVAAGALCIPALTLGGSSPQVDYVALLQSAARSMNNDYSETWAYTETSSDAESTTVGRYDPSRPAGERWTLISIDDRDPTAEESDEYRAGKTNEEESGDGDVEVKNEERDGEREDDVSDTVRPDSLSLLEETDTYWLFSFVPAADEGDDDEDILESLDGTLKIVKDGNYIESLQMQALKPFKPQFGVKVKEFMTRLRFGPAADGGPIVPLSVEVSINVRAFLVANINESSTTTFSDYEHVGKH